MEPIIPTDEFESLGKPAKDDPARGDVHEAPTQIQRPGGGGYLAPSEVHHGPIAATSERCVSCGAPLASDQRYCVECGQRLGRARLPFMDDAAHQRASSAAQDVQRSRVSPNTALIAGVGTLILAMGVGVLIGKTGSNSGRSSNPVTVVSGPTGQTAGTATGTESPSSTSTTATTKATTTTAGKGGKSTSGTSKTTTTPAKVVKVGSPGKGPGYQKGKFTGNFFGEEEK